MGLGVVGGGGVVGKFFLWLGFLWFSSPSFLPSVSTFLWKTEGILAAIVFFFLILLGLTLLIVFVGSVAVFPRHDSHFLFPLTVDLLVLLRCLLSKVVSCVGVVRFLPVCSCGPVRLYLPVAVVLVRRSLLLGSVSV